ncbi:hypothetical protein ES703_38116 [subsurface metagenome]
MDWLSFAANLVNRIPIEKVLFPPRDRTKALEEFAATMTAPVAQKEASLEQTATSTITPQELETPPTQGTACDICSLDHISTCAGILEEANRFARREGVDNPEVIRRISICRQQLNAMERDDANPQKLVELPRIEREIMEKILPKAGKLRHRLNEIVSLETLEQVTAETQDLSDLFQNEIFHLQLKRKLTEKGDKNLNPEVN